MANVRKKKRRDGSPRDRWTFWYIDWQGKRRWGTGTTSKKETLRMAQRIEDEHRQIRAGYLPPPKPKKKRRLFAEVCDEFFAWGESQGGRRGRPWSRKHAESRRRHLGWWGEKLKLVDLDDLDGRLADVEQGLRELRGLPRSPKTVAAYADSLHSFCGWAVKREYLDDHPLRHLGRLDTTPQERRRALLPEEIRRLLMTCDELLRPTYEVAFCTGLRANELRSLEVRHLDVEGCGLLLDEAWTKNRKDGFQAMPRSLVMRLVALTEGKKPTDPLLYVPSHPAREMDKDLKRAGIAKVTGEGKVVFHATRNAYLTAVGEAGGSWKETKELARHESLNMTDRYARARRPRLQQLADAVGDMLLPYSTDDGDEPDGDDDGGPDGGGGGLDGDDGGQDEDNAGQEKCAPYVPRADLGKSASAQHITHKEDARKVSGGGGGNRSCPMRGDPTSSLYSSCDVTACPSSGSSASIDSMESMQLGIVRHVCYHSCYHREST
ncbi:tyrosine-type recombinase/integrase [Planctomycetota bacterium]